MLTIFFVIFQRFFKQIFWPWK